MSVINFVFSVGNFFIAPTLIIIENCEVRACPNSGIRANSADYVIVKNNRVYDNTWWSSNAESAIVFAESASIDDSDIYKMFIVGNEVFNNNISFSLNHEFSEVFFSDCEPIK